MKWNVSLTFIGVVIMLIGCKQSRYPIDEKPVVRIDSRFLGTWRAKEKDKPPLLDMAYTITRRNDWQYNITIKEKDKGKDKEESTTGYLSEIDKVLFMNLHVDDDSGGYIFFKVLNVNAKADRVVAVGIADTTMKYLPGSAAVRALFTKNLSNPIFYRDTVEFYKVK